MEAAFVSRARGMVAAHAPRKNFDIEDAVWFAATVLHDLWLLPSTCLALEAPRKEPA